MHLLRPLLRPSLKWILAVTMLAIVAPRMAAAEALLVIEADSGKVLQADNATMPWYPASLSKLMTAYVTLAAVKQGRVSLDTLITVSPTAASQSPSKMGFRPGTQVTVDNALKMMLVKSANDMAVVLAEGIGGSVDGFAGMMNQTAQKLGMTQTSYVNPNGLPADGQITSARDMAILARAIIRDLPEYEYFVHIPSIRFGRRVTANFNKLIGRYPGADGFKTGFICASGYNLVASATRDGKRLIAVVLGASSGRMRAIRAAQLLDRGFANNGLAWLKPSLGTVDNLVPIDASPPNLREEMCGGKHKRPASDEDQEDTVASAGSAGGGETNMNFFAAGLQAAMPKPSELLALPAAASEPVIVYTGPTKTGAALIAAAAADSEKMQPVKHGKRTRVVIKINKPDAETKGDLKGDAKSDGKAAAKPARHAAAKPDAAVAKPLANKPAAAAKPEKPAAAKPAAKPKAAGKPKSDAKPAS
ncbi:D-alanyl-D-alanine carboxypeptidase family protein [Bradyrhizobium sp. CCBAU 51753]|uniref:D-alanyl-D-alanine carboxypeptidase family protein n=1 Tax=Bradyrhizobium sp. CCBAU 51753 TaxID=1325100 RepID=UPI00188AF979|nr:D-alanyl-D-alanine carboxypeptidase family protein [Bradyrhizobium sp. CCBAU 51753]QOZ23187.1 peptidase M15 [Bradyrhizobium sp. CCBAU 51753]